MARYGEGAPRPAGTVLTVTFRIGNQTILALNGGPQHAGFSEAISLQIDCGGQDEVDRLWSALSAGGEEGRCGWLKDRHELSWQVVPRRLRELLGDKIHDGLSGRCRRC